MFHTLFVSIFQPRDVTNFTVGGFAPMSPRISSPMHHGGGGESTSKTCQTKTLCAAAVFLFFFSQREMKHESMKHLH